MTDSSIYPSPWGSPFIHYSFYWVRSPCFPWWHDSLFTYLHCLCVPWRTAYTPFAPSLFFFFHHYQYFNDDSLVFSAIPSFHHSFNFSACSCFKVCLHCCNPYTLLLLAVSNVFYEQWSSLGGSFGRFYLGRSFDYLVFRFLMRPFLLL